MSISAQPQSYNLRGAQFDNRYAALGEPFSKAAQPVPVQSPQLIALNTALAKQLRLTPSQLAASDGTDIFAGNAIPKGAQPIAQAYAGHQFGHYNPQLGDGRAILLGELLGLDNALYDMQLKGAGRTAFSRGGDGRAALGPVLREFLVSEAMHTLNVPTTRALAAVTTGEMVFRNQALPGAILTRVASSHIRVGTFEFIRASGNLSALQTLADFVIDRHFPESRSASRPLLALFDAVVSAQSSLVTQWMSLGFIHGVMNTDNTAIGGHTIDYGPCAFMERFDPSTVFSSIDQQGRYAYGNQPNIALWNLTRFAECLLPLLPANDTNALGHIEATLNNFSAQFNQHWLQTMGHKMGFMAPTDQTSDLLQRLLAMMQLNQADFTNTFVLLTQALATQDTLAFERALNRAPQDTTQWLSDWQKALAQTGQPEAQTLQAAQNSNPRVIPRNDRIEEVIAAATHQDNFEPFEQLVHVLKTPFAQPDDDKYCQPAPKDAPPYQTFCGT